MAVARSNIEAAAEAAAAASAAAAKFSRDVLELKSLLSDGVASASVLRWHPAENRQGILEAALKSMKHVCNELVHLNAVNGDAPTPIQFSAAPLLDQRQALPSVPALSPATVQPACAAVMPAFISQSSVSSPPVCQAAGPTSSSASAPVASNASENVPKPQFLVRQKSESVPVPLSPPPVAQLSSVEERPVSFSMKPRRPGAPPSRPVPKTPSTSTTPSRSSMQQPTLNMESEITGKNPSEEISLPTSEVQTSHPSAAPAPAKTVAGFALPGMALLATSKNPVTPPSTAPSADLVVSADDSFQVAQVSNLPDVISDPDHPPPRHSAPPLASSSPAPIESMNLASAALNRRGSLRSPSLGAGDAPQFKPPSSPVALAGLKCPEGEGEYEGMDAPMAVCTKCFKKRRAHLSS